MSAQPDYPPEYDSEPPDLGVLDALGHDFADLKRVVATLGENVPMALDVDDTTATVVQLLADLREQRKALAVIEAFVEAAAVKRLRYGQQQVGDLLVEVRSSKDRKEWRNDDLAWAVCRDLAVDPATGEVVAEVAQIVDRVRSRLLLCARPEWRMTPIRDLSLEPDDFCLATSGRKTVQLTAAVEQAAQ